MGLLITKGTDRTIIDSETEYTIEGKSIHIHGTDIELPSVYARIEYVAHADGKTVSVTFKTYKDYSYFETNEDIYTDIQTKGFDFAILETEEQSLAVVFQYCILKFEDLGYTAVIG